MYLRTGTATNRRSSAARTATALTAATASVLLLSTGAGAAAGPVRAPDQPNAPGPASVEAELLDQLDQAGEAPFWVHLESQADLSAATTITDWVDRGTFVHEDLTAVAERSQADLRRMLTSRGVEFTPFWITNAIKVTGDRELVDELAARPEVAEIRGDRTYQIPEPVPAQAPPSIDAVEWGIDRIRAPEVWDVLGVRGEGIVVGTIDTGVRFDHPALVGQYRGNLGGSGFDHDYNWHDPSNICGNPSLVPCDNVGHGTHVTGTIVGDDGGDNQIGVAPGAQWIAAKGCEVSSCSQGALLSSGQFMLAPTDLAGQNPRPDLRPHVVNNSWGGASNNDPWYRSTVQAWVAAGIFPQFSAGNAGPACGTAGNPGNMPEASAAGAFDIDNAIADFSSRGPSAFGGEVKPDLAAPGVAVRSSHANGGYATFSGTSMASPHVAGTVALIWSASPAVERDVAATRSLLDQTAIDNEDLQCGGTQQDNNVWGEGRLDAFAAVIEAPGSGITGILEGTVTDAASGAPVAGAAVTATGETSRTTFADSDGDYAMSLLPGGYQVAASATGYFPGPSEGVTIVEDQTTGHDITLDPAPAIAPDPTQLDVRQGPDESRTHTLTIGNQGGGGLEWNVHDDSAATVQAEPALEDEVTVSHSASQEVVPGNSDACLADDGSTAENAYLRTFVLDQHDIFGDFQVTQVTFGIEEAFAEQMDLTINLFQKEVAAALRYENLQLVGSRTVSLPVPQRPGLVTLAVAGGVTAGAELVVEIEAADLSGSGVAQRFLAGSNRAGQSAPSYIRAEACGWTEPTDIGQLRGLPDMQLVMSVTGLADLATPPPCAVPSGTPWVGITPTSGTVAPGDAQDVTLTFDTAGLAAGDTRRSLLCLESNDPEQPLTLLPLTLVVVEVPVIDVIPGSLAADQPPDTVTEQSLTIHNDGHALLEWAINPDLVGPPRQRRELLQNGVLLVPDHSFSTKRVMAFDPETGDIIDADFIPDPFLFTPIYVIGNQQNDGLLLSDRTTGEINVYDLDGAWTGVFAPAGGADTSILHDPNGMRFSPDGTLLVPVGVGIGDNNNAVAEFDAEGNYLGNFIDNGAAGLAGPRYLELRESDILVSGNGGVHSFGYDGSHNSVFSDDFLSAAQIQELDNGNVLVAELSVSSGATRGIREFTPGGDLVGVYTGGLIGHQGVYELPNGNILTTNHQGVHEIERGDGLVETKISGVQAGFISYVQLDLPACELPADVPWLDVSPVSGATDSGGSSQVTVTFDSTGLPAGVHETELCIQNNDPNRPLVVVPVSLTVDDDEEPPPDPEIELLADLFKLRGDWFVTLTWSGATSEQVDIYRDGELLETVDNAGEYTDELGKPRNGTVFGYRVCEHGTQTCSDEVPVTIGSPGHTSTSIAEVRLI